MLFMLTLWDFIKWEGSSTMFKRQPISFNLDCPHQKELYEWCKSNSVNFSGFVKDVLFLYKQSQNNNSEKFIEQKFTAVVQNDVGEVDVISQMF